MQEVFFFISFVLSIREKRLYGVLLLSFLSSGVDWVGRRVSFGQGDNFFFFLGFGIESRGWPRRGESRGQSVITLPDFQGIRHRVSRCQRYTFTLHSDFDVLCFFLFASCELRGFHFYPSHVLVRVAIFFFLNELISIDVIIVVDKLPTCLKPVSWKSIY